RTPMQWDKSKNAGFSTAAKTWLWIPPSAVTYNVEVQKKDPNSILNFYKKLIALRRTNRAVRDGAYVTLNPDDPNVLSFLRKGQGSSVLVALNMRSHRQTIKFDLSGQGITATKAQLLLSAPKAAGDEVVLGKVTVPAFGVLIAEVK